MEPSDSRTGCHGHFNTKMIECKPRPHGDSVPQRSRTSAYDSLCNVFIGVGVRVLSTTRLERVKFVMKGGVVYRH